MTEQEILAAQERNGNKEFYLILVGSFYHAYGRGAFCLARATKYRVMRKKRKYGEVLTCGFPATKLMHVESLFKAAGAFLTLMNNGIYRFSGFDATPDDNLVCEPATRPFASATAVSLKDDPVRSKLKAFQLSASTPMDAMVLVNELQRMISAEEQRG